MHKEILELLEQTYPNPRTALHHDTPFQLLVATILSAQCTDDRVNMITPALFAQFPTAETMANASYAEVSTHVKSAGLWQTKSQNIIRTAQILVEKHNGQVPNTREELEALPGVGRKTANVVLSNAFQIPAIAVDTHVFRVANRLGLANSKSPIQVEKELMERIPRERWSEAHHWLIFHGREICKARTPLCHECPLQAHCAYYNNLSTGS